jgi:hypothetical protein
LTIPARIARYIAFLEKHGYKVKPPAAPVGRPKATGRIDRDKVQRLHSEGKTAAEIAAACECSAVMVYQILNGTR